MAYTSVIPVFRLDNTVEYVTNEEKTTAVKKDESLKGAIGYAMNKDKTEQMKYVDSLHCFEKTAYEDMTGTKKTFDQPDGVQGYHMIQSFAEGELTPELAHKIGMETAERVLGGRFEAVVTTHLNTKCLHNHIVWNSVSFQDGRKYHSNEKSYYTEIRRVSDELCRKYGLSVISPQDKGMHYKLWMETREGESPYRAAVRADIDQVISRVFSWQQFIRELKKMGYQIKFTPKYVSVRPPGGKQNVRLKGKTLGKGYSSWEIKERILHSDKFQRKSGVGYVKKKVQYAEKKPPRRKQGFRASYYTHLFMMGAMPRKPKRNYAAYRAEIRKLDQYIERMGFLNKYGIDTIDQLRVKQRVVQEQISGLQKERYRLYRTKGDPDRVREITQALRPLRKEDKLCRQIKDHTLEMSERRRKIQELEQKKAPDKEQKKR